MSTQSIEAVLTARATLTREEAAARARTLAEVHLDLTTGPEVFGSTTRLTFEVLEPTETHIDLSAVEVRRVELDGQRIEPATTLTRLQLPRLDPGQHELVVDAVMAYRNEG